MAGNMDSELLLTFIWYFLDYLSALSRTLLRFFGQPLSKQLYINAKSLLSPSHFLTSNISLSFQILAGQDFSPWSKYAEETETWGDQALAAVAPKRALYSDKYDSDSGVVSRLRAISLASSVPDQHAEKHRRQLSISAKLSTSAPFQQGGLQQKDRQGNVMALQTGAQAPGTSLFEGLLEFSYSIVLYYLHIIVTV